MSVWINFEVERMNLDYNMDTMQIDSEGLWIDPGAAIGMNGLAALDCPNDDPWEKAQNEGRERIVPNDKDKSQPTRKFSPPQENFDSEIRRTSYESPVHPESQRQLSNAGRSRSIQQNRPQSGKSQKAIQLGNSRGWQRQTVSPTNGRAGSVESLGR